MLDAAKLADIIYDGLGREGCIALLQVIKSQYMRDDLMSEIGRHLASVRFPELEEGSWAGVSEEGVAVNG